MRPGRPKLPVISEEMKAWSAALLSELTGWPRVTTRPFFGLHAVCRGPCIFALLPRTRALETASSIAFKLEDPAPRLLRKLANDPRVRTTLVSKNRWFTLELDSERDLREALGWLERAYEAARRH